MDIIDNRFVEGVGAVGIVGLSRNSRNIKAGFSQKSRGRSQGVITESASLIGLPTTTMSIVTASEPSGRKIVKNCIKIGFCRLENSVGITKEVRRGRNA
ncbi:hypothetical protein GV64_10545 [Endozoicomonas elysicola]|uniref:Uncharacterized protein n=1 Tax=Endozoicomonas elysicola TaxID=305900 RepID=A0A081KAF1_9GAMM|nr:hypothetical protein GV64_10545 [Endozoicomonas elysicola]